MNNELANQFAQLVQTAKNILIIQPDNLDGDSIATAVALEEILDTQGKEVSLYTATDVPRYLRYIRGWDRISNEFPKEFDLTLILDCSNPSLLESTLKNHQERISSKPAVIIDHHSTKFEMPFETLDIFHDAGASTSEVVFALCEELDWKIPASAAENLLAALMSDTLGLTTDTVGIESVRMVYELAKRGAVLSEMDARRREFGKRSIEIMRYKGELIKRIEFHDNDQIASVIIPWEEIEAYSEQYNPSQLFIEEALQIESVRLCVAFKVYDRRITAKIRSTAPVSHLIAQHFGGGGHPKSAGCKVDTSDIDSFKKEFIQKTIEELANFQDSE